MEVTAKLLRLGVRVRCRVWINLGLVLKRRDLRHVQYVVNLDSVAGWLDATVMVDREVAEWVRVDYLRHQSAEQGHHNGDQTNPALHAASLNWATSICRE